MSVTGSHGREIGIGVVGSGYMGKAHSVALTSVGAIFDTALRPRLEMIATSRPETAAEAARALGFARSSGDWRALVADPAVEAVCIASPQSTHRAIAEAALALGKPVFCEKPLGCDIEDARAMAAAAERAGAVHMTGFNYIRTPASQEAAAIIASGEIGRITHFDAEHVEDFLADPDRPANWRTRGRATGTMGDLAPHVFNAVLRLLGPVAEIMADIVTFHPERMGPDGPEPCNDDFAQMFFAMESGARGSVRSSRAATGRKMGYAYQIFGTKGAIRFDQEDQNALHLYSAAGPEGRRGFTKILTGPAHPDYLAFCQGPGHGTGYQDQIIIEMKDFLEAVAAGAPRWPTFHDGVATQALAESAWRSHGERRWVALTEI